MPTIDCLLAIVVSPIVGVYLGIHVGIAIGDLAGWPRVPFYNFGGALLFEG